MMLVAEVSEFSLDASFFLLGGPPDSIAQRAIDSPYAVVMLFEQDAQAFEFGFSFDTGLAPNGIAGTFEMFSSME